MPNSQSFTLTHEGRANVLVCECAVAEAFDPTDVTAAAAAKFHVLRAIWDTGATNTCIDEEACARMSLVATGQVETHTANGVKRANTYLVNIGLPNHVGFPGVRVTECSAIPNADMLIGMDIIGAGDFAVTNHGGKTVMTYRYPSSKLIDFVVEHGNDKIKEHIADMHRRHSHSRKKRKKK